MDIEKFPAIWKVEFLSINFSNKLENLKLHSKVVMTLTYYRIFFLIRKSSIAHSDLLWVVQTL